MTPNGEKSLNLIAVMKTQTEVSGALTMAAAYFFCLLRLANGKKR
jgi:hypothetical protein